MKIRFRWSPAKQDANTGKPCTLSHKYLSLDVEIEGVGKEDADSILLRIMNMLHEDKKMCVVSFGSTMQAGSVFVNKITFFRKQHGLVGEQKAGILRTLRVIRDRLYQEKVKSLDICFLVQEFYAMEAVMALLIARKSGFETLRHSHERWRSDFESFRDDYVKKLAAAIYDYTVLVVAGELRHCERRASEYLSGFFSDLTPRCEVYYNSIKYRAQDILAAGVKMFDVTNVSWNKSYGGKLWMQIAQAGQKKDDLSDSVFIDHCVDLSHNSGIYFDKGAGILILKNKERYKVILDNKRICEPRAFLCQNYGSMLNHLLLRANNLHIFDVAGTGNSNQVECDECESNLLSYTPLRWGEKPLESLLTSATSNRDRDNRRNEEECNHRRNRILGEIATAA